ncbi:hypothetical protein AKJ16_DCAP20806 [Drosera capensis]
MMSVHRLRRKTRILLLLSLHCSVEIIGGLSFALLSELRSYEGWHQTFIILFLSLHCSVEIIGGLTSAILSDLLSKIQHTGGRRKIKQVWGGQAVLIELWASRIKDGMAIGIIGDARVFAAHHLYHSDHLLEWKWRSIDGNEGDFCGDDRCSVHVGKAAVELPPFPRRPTNAIILAAVIQSVPFIVAIAAKLMIS